MNYEAMVKLFGCCIPVCKTQNNEIRYLTDTIHDWMEIICYAEKFGFTSLLYGKIKEFDISLPAEADLMCQIIVKRHFLSNQAKMRVLEKITMVFQENSIQSIALKGAALANVLYPNLSDRPMADLDVLISQSMTAKVSAIMKEMGFSCVTNANSYHSCAHLPTLQIKQDGFPVNVEIHQFLCQDTSSHPWLTLDDLQYPTQQFMLFDRCPVSYLFHEEMLFHLCWHAFYDHRSFQPLNYLWISDILNYAEKFKEQINWDVIRRDFSIVINSLSVLNGFVPLSENLISKLGFDTSCRYHHAGSESFGWPMIPISEFRRRGFLKTLKRTLFPSDWWLYLHYGKNGQTSIYPYWQNHITDLFAESRERIQLRIRKNFGHFLRIPHG